MALDVIFSISLLSLSLSLLSPLNHTSLTFFSRPHTAGRRERGLSHTVQWLRVPDWQFFPPLLLYRIYSVRLIHCALYHDFIVVNFCRYRNNILPPPLSLILRHAVLWVAILSLSFFLLRCFYSHIIIIIIHDFLLFLLFPDTHYTFFLPILLSICFFLFLSPPYQAQWRRPASTCSLAV